MIFGRIYGRRKSWQGEAVILERQFGFFGHPTINTDNSWIVEKIWTHVWLYWSDQAVWRVVWSLCSLYVLCYSDHKKNFCWYKQGTAVRNSQIQVRNCTQRILFNKWGISEPFLRSSLYTEGFPFFRQIIRQRARKKKTERNVYFLFHPALS